MAIRPKKKVPSVFFFFFFKKGLSVNSQCLIIFTLYWPYREHTFFLLFVVFRILYKNLFSVLHEYLNSINEYKFLLSDLIYCTLQVKILSINIFFVFRKTTTMSYKHYVLNVTQYINFYVLAHIMSANGATAPSSFPMCLIWYYLDFLLSISWIWRFKMVSVIYMDLFPNPLDESCWEL